MLGTTGFQPQKDKGRILAIFATEKKPKNIARINISSCNLFNEKKK